MTEPYLVLLETSGNQNYIFSTNKQKENIGASEFTYQAGTYWVMEAVATQNKEVLFKDWREPQKLRSMLRNNDAAREKSERKAEIIVAASGKALILAKNQDTARKIISAVTRKALIEAPGLDVSGVYIKVANWEAEGSLAEGIARVHREFEKAKSRRPSPESRFLRLPIVTSCAESGQPASQLEGLSKAQKESGQRPKPISRVSATKRKIALEAKERLKAIDERLASQIDQILQEDVGEDQRSWLGVVHADGNGLGQIFLKFEEYIGKDKSSQTYIQKYREFSLALDECTETAFKKALEVLPEASGQGEEKFAPVVPLIIGGDDLTVVCDGRYALEFTRVFLQEFEVQTERHPGVQDILREIGVNCLSACAGVAIVKRHFPFSVAYELAEQLIESAKEVKKKVTKQGDSSTPFPCSAIDFHILYDTSNLNLADIRQKLVPEAGIQLFNRPYVVSNIENLAGADGQAWAERHAWKRLSDRIHWLNSKQPSQQDRDPLSRSQSHAIRTALFIDKSSADAQYQLIQQRYDLQKFAESETEDSLFYATGEGTYATSFLDALDAAEFFENAANREPQTTTEAAA